jgi:hypothetical protein
MSTIHETIDVLRQLRSGEPDAAVADRLVHMSASALVADIRKAYPVLFQERAIGRKREIGAARALRFEFCRAASVSPALCLVPVLWKCVFVSSYDDVVSEVTSAVGIRVRPAWNMPHKTVLRLGPGVKFDNTAEEWRIRRLEQRIATLSDAFLRKRGWKFEVLAPFSRKR